MQPAKTPRILWIELTSKCPFDCVFCSRKSRRGGGEHMEYGLFESLVRQVSDPRKFLLNYAGESTVYSELISAIGLARSTGAAVELVSALASATDALLEQLTRSGLTRLTVSIHAASAAAFSDIYRHSSLDAMRSRLARLMELCGRVAHPPMVDAAFVAMRQNLGELAAVAEMSEELGVRQFSIFPVIRRDEIPVVFPDELTPQGAHRTTFREAVNRSVQDARQRFPKMAFTICNPMFTNAEARLGAAPTECPGELPEGARIHSCEQNPWETAHVLANGDVVACEVHDRAPLGNLGRQSLAEIWQGEEYRRFRGRYQTGESTECRTCPWKTAYIPERLRSEIVASRGRSAQLWHGWHEPSGEGHIWASQHAVAVVEPRAGSDALHIRGVLPPGPAGEGNDLSVACDGAAVGLVINRSAEMLLFEVDLPVSRVAGGPWQVEFRTDAVYRPVDRGTGPDQRDLGFALIVLAAHRMVDGELVRRQSRALAPLIQAVREIDRLGRRAGRLFKRSLWAQPARALGPGLSVIIPERNNVRELSACLAGLHESARLWPEPLEVHVVVNGSGPGQYQELRARYPRVRWQVHPLPLGFCGAIRAGLSEAHFDWVYLMNSDVRLDADALRAAAGYRDPQVFSIASQIVLKDPTRFRDETNLTTLFLDKGLVTIHDLIPKSAGIVEHFYAGGGASMFQRRVLAQVLDEKAYHPAYWEDVEWGWRARKLGYRSVFCGASVAHHTQGATISRCYSAAEIETIVARNRLLFQLRNVTTAGSLEDVAAAIARAPGEVADYFLHWRALWGIASGRLWNFTAPVPDEKVLKAGL